jgi:hypothetical protein
MKPCATVIVDQLADLVANVAERVVPTHTLELAIGPLHGIEQPIGRVV